MCIFKSIIAHILWLETCILSAQSLHIHLLMWAWIIWDLTIQGHRPYVRPLKSRLMHDSSLAWPGRFTWNLPRAILLKPFRKFFVSLLAAMITFIMFIYTVIINSSISFWKSTLRHGRGLHVSNINLHCLLLATVHHGGFLERAIQSMNHSYGVWLTKLIF